MDAIRHPIRRDKHSNQQIFDTHSLVDHLLHGDGEWMMRQYRSWEKGKKNDEQPVDTSLLVFLALS